ncbi:MAG: carbohydrate ABC transporter substrate-binding protein, partial [Acholeplasmataceae bacterium]|nr:carbohydrate ABC transporter substrate-binding protein [Acholeplasmataceae bacterium]
MKKIYSILFLLLTAILLVGCFNKKEGVTIFIHGQTHERGIYQKIIDKFTEETGIKVNAELVNA